MPAERVTVTVPPDLLRDMDRRAPNRSRFQEAIRHELFRRRREDLERSLAAPHPESRELAESGLGDWASGLPEEDVRELLDPDGGVPVRWSPGEGWRDEER